MEPAGTSGAAPAAPAFSSPDVEAAVKLAIGPAVHAAVQATLAAMAAASAAGEGASGAAVSTAASPEALAEALKPVVAALQEVTQAVRSTEGQLVKAVQGSTQQLLARMDAHAVAAYNVVVDAHNQTRIAHSYDAPLMARKNSAGELPPAGLFPKTLREANALGSECSYHVGLNLTERNQRLVKLYRFYGAQSGGKPWPAEEALPGGYREAAEEFNTRARSLKPFLRLE